MRRSNANFAVFAANPHRCVPAFAQRPRRAHRVRAVGGSSLCSALLSRRGSSWITDEPLVFAVPEDHLFSECGIFTEQRTDRLTLMDALDRLAEKWSAGEALDL